MYLVIQELLIKLQSRVENAACHEHSIDIVQEKGIQKHVLELISFLFHPLYFLVNCQWVFDIESQAIAPPLPNVVLMRHNHYRGLYKGKQVFYEEALPRLVLEAECTVSVKDILP